MAHCMVQTPAGGLRSFGSLFKINKDGTGYSVLHNFSGPSVDGDTPSSLFEAGNRVFFGTTKHGAGAVGSVFALTQLPLRPRILSELVSNNFNLLQFALSVGTPYKLLRSTNLISWDVLATISSPSNGICFYRDFNTPQPAAFYRLLQQ